MNDVVSKDDMMTQVIIGEKVMINEDVIVIGLYFLGTEEVIFFI